MNTLIVIILVALSFGLLVIGHEFGHFIVAKINKVKVEEFAIGMGPLIFKFQGKETVYSLRLLPIGGYVKMLGEYDESDQQLSDEDRKRSYTSQSPLRKISIILAGPIMNFILAFIIFFGLNIFSGYNSTVVSEVVEGSPAQSAGIRVGDKITELNSKKFLTWKDFVFELQMVKDKSNINLTVLRNSEKLNFNIKPDIRNGSVLIGIKPTFVKNSGFIDGISNGFKETVSEAKQVILSIYYLITGRVSFKDLGGPVTIFKVSGQAAKAGFAQLMNFTAFLSVNLGVFNLIPFPALDGGSFIVNLIELISKKKINQQILAKINYIGFALLILLMIVVTLKDIFFPII